jgi:(p)ppGpp synthase/HD superfamily hydrolase
VIRFEDLLEKVREYNPDADVELLRRAYVFSALEHKGQVRHSGEPYLVHPLEVATILTDMKMDAVTIAAGSSTTSSRTPSPRPSGSSRPSAARSHTSSRG